ncbi:MAG: DUF2520 domain-containing protein [Bacteroidales bacterium]|nr:DUF2520 domain-containing protein [Bacteroidales bacterium]
MPGPEIEACKPFTSSRKYPNKWIFGSFALATMPLVPIIHQLGDGLPACAHTAGTLPMEVFAGHAGQYGVFYPLQTFTQGVPLDYSKIPFLIEGNAPDCASMLIYLARKISSNVTVATSEQRRKVHLAAVMASNFGNYLLKVAKDILGETDLTILRPLMEETLRKAFLTGPEKTQTGPATRGNAKVMEEHIKMLDGNEEWREIYRLMSEGIMKSKRLA